MLGLATMINGSAGQPGIETLWHSGLLVTENVYVAGVTRPSNAKSFVVQVLLLIMQHSLDLISSFDVSRLHPNTNWWKLLSVYMHFAFGISLDPSKQ
jgi:hypothetical protein